ncbi:MAG: magnesium transporter [Planctomycetes bacterium]|nr:magnesium transporter [Planctomycetota bacterium]
MAPADDLADEPLTLQGVRDAWVAYDEDDRVAAFRGLPRPDAEDLFLELPAKDQATLVGALPPPERRSWVRLLAPDDAADLVQQVPPTERAAWIALLDETTQKDVAGLLAFAEDDAGGLMHPRYVRLRPDLSVDEAISYLRRASRDRVGTSYYAYVLDADSVLLGVVSVRELFASSPEKRVRDVMRTDVVKADETMDQEALATLFRTHDLVAVPVVDASGRMKGVVTFDDIGDVLVEEATEDIQKIGGTEALDAPYLRTPLWQMVRKRAGWLAALFVGELFTASAMSRFEDEIRAATVLSLFIPLIISSGGNSGSQATTLVIRAMALGEVTLRDWWRVVKRELASGLALGAILAPIGVLRIFLWQRLHLADYTEHYMLVAATVGIAVVGVVTWGTLAGSMLPFVLRRMRLDPASASAPFVATLVDVSGLVIYFEVAAAILTGTLL